MKQTIKRVVAVAMMLALTLSMGTFVYATGTTTATMNGLTMQFGDPNYDATPPESNMRFTATTNGFAVSYENGIDNFYPNSLAFYVTAGQTTITGMSGDGVTAQPSIKNSDDEIVATDSWTTGFYVLYIDTATAGNKTLTINASGGNVVLTFTVPTFTASTGSKIYAYLPAPGQFTNEGITTGGWGDAYDSTGSLKNNTATGVSLGFYGGYVVYDFGQITYENQVYQGGGIYNSSTTPYGTDFIVFGNGFWANSEPGLIQVSKDGTTWYDIAGSKYYDSAVTFKNQTITYTVPTANHTEDVDYELSDIQNNYGTPQSIDYSGSISGTIGTNAFHYHGWFPYNTNYFVARTSTASEMSKIDTLPFASRTLSDGVTNTLTFTGLRLASVNTSNTQDYQFGYADVHANVSLGGTTSYNPYSRIDSSSVWSIVSNGTSGGDPIDISWAVTSTGAPAKLDAIRFVRVYTGVAQMNGMFGEVSTEVCGITVCEGTANDSTVSPTITLKGMDRATTNGGIKDFEGLGSAAVNISVTGTGNIYINGVKCTSGENKLFTPSSEGTIVQVIFQGGDAAPYITWLRLYS